MDGRPSARLFVILARSAPVGVVLRRGPSNWVQVIRWHTDTDTFEEGHWFKGRIYWRRLQRDGWELIERGKFSRVRSRRWGYQAEQPEVWQRPDPTGTLRLVMSLIAIAARGPGRWYVLRFEVVGRRRKPRITLDGATWADWDHAGRLVAAQDGRLLIFDPYSATPAVPTVLADFNDRVPAPLPPPEHATRW